jgi:hypothetical protein
LAFSWPIAAVVINIVVAILWLVPDKRFEQLIE